MKVLAIIQARMGSTRLPGKVMRQIGGKPVIEWVLNRAASASRLTDILVAMPEKDENSALADYVAALGYKTSFGPEADVLARFHDAASAERPDIVVRITADCPFIDPELIDEVVDRLVAEDADYASNTAPATFPDGLDVEAFNLAALVDAHEQAVAAHHREHVTVFMRESKRNKCVNVTVEGDYAHHRWTVDEPEDLRLAEAVAARFSAHERFTWRELLQFVTETPALSNVNSHLGRNEGASMSDGQKLWSRAKRVMLGGTSLLSKRPDMLLPDQWPTYYTKAKGCHIWDLEGRRFTDVSLMGVGTNILGYAREEVNAAVVEAAVNGNMSTFNCAEEVLLAERLVEMNPWSDMVRFARTGGEANAVAIRIGRAASGKDGVAVCGYHGWHDWYLSLNLAGRDKLNTHLLPGLDPLGVPSGIKDSVFGFEYNNFEELRALVDTQDIGVIKMEVFRNQPPTDGFLQKVRALASERGIVLVFDECTSGFRQTFGGLHSLYDVEPDMAVFGKALGNGFAITAVVGRREVMEKAQASFISSTFWTERSGPAAALATLNLMQQEESWNVITERGNDIKERWRAVSDRYDLGMTIAGLPALASFAFGSPNASALQTLFTQEMLKKGFLATGAVYVSTAHTEDIIDEYFAAADPVFELIGDCMSGRPCEDLLEGPVKQSGFARLN